MGFLVFLLAGAIGGVLGGMGMGGGTALIPILTLFCGTGQSVAQGVNLLSFLPMSLCALAVHKKNGLLSGRDIFPMLPSALLSSVLFSLLASALPSAVLKTFFGVFLILLSFFRLKDVLFEKKP